MPDEPTARPAGHVEDTRTPHGLVADVRWLPPEQVRVGEDNRGRLMLTIDGERHEGVQVSKLFALTDPERFISFRDSQGTEIGILKEPAGLAPDSRQLVRRHLERQYFIPVIEEVLQIREFWIDQTWTVRTDRGLREFTIQGRDAIRFVSERGLLLIDLDDNRYLISDRHALDAASGRWVDRFVW